MMINHDFFTVIRIDIHLLIYLFKATLQHNKQIDSVLKRSTSPV